MSGEAKDTFSAKARERALRFLEGRDRTRREVELRLARYGYEPQIVAQVVGWLEELGYLGDNRYAAAYAAEKKRAGWGAVRIRQALLRKGVQPELAHSAAADSPPAEEVLVDLVRRRYGQLAEADPASARRKAAAFLARKGHEWEVVTDVVARALGDSRENGRHAGES